MIKDYRTERWEGCKDFFKHYVSSGDCDPAYPALVYCADKMKLDIEQRYWLAFLYSTCYCGPTAAYMFHCFPSYQKAGIKEVYDWWFENKHKLLFQTDRKKVKSFNVFPEIFDSYKNLIGDSQEAFFAKLLVDDKESSYDNVWKEAGRIFYFGQFSLFLFLESIHVLTGLLITPSGLNLKASESARNGLCYATSRDDWVTLRHKLPEEKPNFGYLNFKLRQLKNELTRDYPELGVTYWNIETMLCAYKKLFWQTRYLYYYIDRFQEEIKKVEESVRGEMNMKMLWDFRKEFFDHRFLGEIQGWDGIRKERLSLFVEEGVLGNI